MIRYKDTTITTLKLEATPKEPPLTTEQQAKVEAMARRMAQDMQDAMAYAMMGMVRPPAPTRADLLRSRDELKDRRLVVYRALLRLRQMRPMPVLIIPKGETRPENWTLEPPEETPEETKARSQLADLTVALRKVLMQIADLHGMTERDRMVMLQREMMLESWSFPISSTSTLSPS